VGEGANEWVLVTSWGNGKDASLVWEVEGTVWIGCHCRRGCENG
jgi:hypothetical protein